MYYNYENIPKIYREFLRPIVNINSEKCNNLTDKYAFL